MSVIFKGALANIDPTSIEYIFDPIQGRRIVERYRGKVDILAGRLGQYENSGTEYHLIKDREPFAELSVTRRFDSGETYRWELTAEVLEKDIFTFPAYANEMDANGKGAYKRAILDAVDQETGLPTTPINYAAMTYAKEIYDLLLQGQTHYITKRFVARRQRTITGASGPVPIVAYPQDYVFTTAQVGFPNDILWSLPNQASLTAPPRHRWGWLVMGARSEWEGSNVVQTHELVFAAWGPTYPNAPGNFSPT